MKVGGDKRWEEKSYKTHHQMPTSLPPSLHRCSCAWLRGYRYVLTHVAAEGASVVIGYDGRHNSKDFANRAAAAFLQKGFGVHLFSSIVPTPYVAHATTNLGCACGIMVTVRQKDIAPPTYISYLASNGGGWVFLVCFNTHVTPLSPKERK